MRHSIILFCLTVFLRLKVQGLFNPDPHFATKAIHAGQDSNKWSSKAIVPPITMAVNFNQDTPTMSNKPGFVYSRAKNPTRTVLEECIAALDRAEETVTFSSGSAAIDAIIRLLKSGDHMICQEDVWNGAKMYFEKVAKESMAIEVDYVNLTEPRDINKYLKPNTKLVWLESPANPSMNTYDIRMISKLAHKSKGRPLVAVDNTFLSSYFQNPLELGADITMHSLTKYMNGHEDVIMGGVSTNFTQVAKKLREIQFRVGSIPSPFDCFLVNRGLKTLPLRMRQHSENSMFVAEFLRGNDTHPNQYIKHVAYPPFKQQRPFTKAYQLMTECQGGYSGMMSFYLNADGNATTLFLKSLKMIHIGASLGGAFTIAQQPYFSLHVSIEEKGKLGVTPNMVRLHVGLEYYKDIIDDLDQAMKKAMPLRR